MSPTVLATVATPGGLPLGLGVNSTTNKVYVAVRDESGQGRLVVINGATNAVLYDPPSLVGRNPSSVAVNEVTNKAYVVNNVSLAPTDPAISVVNGADDTITHIPDSVVPGGNPIDVAVNASTNRFYVTHNNNVAVFNGATNALVTDLFLAGFTVAYGVATNSSTNLVYVVTYTTGPEVADQGVGKVYVINGDTNAVVTTIPVGSYPNQVAVDRGSNKIYVSNSDPGTVSVIDGVTNEVVTTVTVGSNSYDLAVNETTHHVYVANSGGSSVSVIKGSDNTVAATLPMGTSAQVIGVNATTDRAYAGVGTSSGTVKVIGNFEDTTPPSITDVSDSNDPFSPNGDGVNESTLLRWRLSEDAWVQLHILDGEGSVLRLLVDQQESAGILQGVTWDGKIGTYPDLTVAPDGTYTYRITATDAAENGSQVSGTSTIETPKPDLVVTSLTAPAVAERDALVSFTATIENQGTATATADLDPPSLAWAEQVWLSTSPTSIEGASPVGGRVAQSSLAPGESYTTTFSGTVTVAPGNYWFILETDSNSQIDESDETNNLSAGVPVTVPGCRTAPVVTLFDNSNTGGVSNGGTSPSFSTESDHCITEVTHYHYNGGAGATPGSIGLSGPVTLGPAAATGSNGPGLLEPPFINWFIRPALGSWIAPAGTYSCVDSDPATWSQNEASDGKGFCTVKGVPYVAPPAPPPPPPDLTGVAECGETILPFARVQLRSGQRVLLETTADEDGAFAFFGVEDGTYDLVYISVDGSTTCGAQTSITENVTDTIELPLCEPGEPTWTTAAPIGEGNTTGAICRQGASAWYKVSLPPEAIARLRLTGPDGGPLSPDLNLFLYRDIAAEAAKTVESKSDWTAQFAGSEFIGSEFIGGEFIGGEFIGGEFIGGEFIGGEFIGGEFIGSEFIGGEFIGSEFIGGEFIGSEFIGGEFIGSEFIGGEFIGGEFIGGEFIGFNTFGEELGLGGLDPLAFSSAVPNSLIRVSINKGSQPESIAHYTWERGGDYYLQVRGRNGAFSLGDSFELGVEVAESACSTIDTEIGASSLEPPGGAVPTLILSNSARFPDAQRPTLTTALASLAAATGGYVADLAGDEALGAAYAQWDASTGCSLAANEVADGIKEYIDAFRGAHPETARIVFAGSDKVLPFRRVEDPAKLAPEWWHVPPVKGTTNTGLRTNKILTDDYYTADHPIVKGNYTIFVPSLATGRLVETADEIANMVQAYVDANGTVAAQTGVVTGYSFLDDLAEDLEGQLQASGVNVTSLIQNEPGLPTAADAWSAADLSSAIAADPDLLWLNVHHTTPGTFLAADYSKLTSGDILALQQANPALLRGSVVFMTACHSVFNVPDTDNIGDALTGEVTRRPDSAQAFARLGATAIGGTGYQYGETIRGVKAYSERLHLLLLRVLREGSGPVELGAALAEAKRRYVGEITEMEDVHAKVPMVATLYGVPGLTVDLGGPQLTPPSDLAAFSYSDLDQVTRNPGKDPTLDLRTIEVELVETPTRHDVTLGVLGDDGETLSATYFSGSDGTIANPGEPILPRITVPLRVESETDTFVRGAVFLGGTFTNVTDATPITATPAYQLGEAVPYFFSADAFPAIIHRINYIGGDNLIVTPAQYRSARSANGALQTFGTWRRFGETSFRLFYSPLLTETVDTEQGPFQAALAAPPTLISQTSRAEGDTLGFEAFVSAEPHVGVQEVWVTWTADGLNGFASIGLAQDPNDGMRWTGTLTLPDGVAPESVRYMLQTVSGVGVASRWTNLGSLYSAEAAAVEVAPKVATSIELSVPTDLVALRARSVTARLVDADGAGLTGKQLAFALGAERLTRFTNGDGYATARFEVTARPGAQSLEVSFAEDATHLGSSVAQSVEIVKETTSLVLTVSPAVQQLGGSVEAEAVLTDGLGRRLREQTVFFQVRDAAGAVRQVAAEEADFNGVARASIPLHVGAGIWTLTAAFGGTVELVGTATDLTHPRYEGSLSAPFYLVVYDPSGGSVTAGGWIVADPATRRGFADDKIHFGLTWRYGKDTTPQGSLKLGYKEDDPKVHIKFHSKTADWLVVSGSVAEVEGTGTLNGVDGYRWRARITDDPDGFSIRIWDASSSYSSPLHRAERTPIDHGSTKIH